MKHQDFRHAAVGEALEAIEASILPSLTLLIDRAAGAEPGKDAALRGDELRQLAAQLEGLSTLLEIARPASQRKDPFSTEA